MAVEADFLVVKAGLGGQNDEVQITAGRIAVVASQTEICHSPAFVASLGDPGLQKVCIASLVASLLDPRFHGNLLNWGFRPLDSGSIGDTLKHIIKFLSQE